ncbi:uncharacterized protein LOC117221546 isoform X2 [Megalopta genalis]|uniref:uncharacterized protein LOC117221546 isoform X2 n=1 Tax=Megalopta genalis TaxID=115081 RepID=UPI003FD15806
MIRSLMLLFFAESRHFHRIRTSSSQHICIVGPGQISSVLHSHWLRGPTSNSRSLRAAWSSSTRTPRAPIRSNRLNFFDRSGIFVRRCCSATMRTVPGRSKVKARRNSRFLLSFANESHRNDKTKCS